MPIAVAILLMTNNQAGQRRFFDVGLNMIGYRLVAGLLMRCFEGLAFDPGRNALDMRRSDTADICDRMRGPIETLYGSDYSKLPTYFRKRDNPLALAGRQS